MNSNNNPSMPCPSCNTILQLDVADVLAGKKIECTQCGANIGLDNNSLDSLSDPLAQRHKIEKIIRDKNENNLDHDQ